jgi:ADP-heptose:LPS heptosyltransferase
MKILVIRPDNIGDLVLTTPVFAALRGRFPAASIEALVNSYNAPVLAGHPDVDRLHVYTKSKHREAGVSGLGQFARVARQWLALRERRFDHVIVCAPGFHPRQVRVARTLRAREVTAFVPRGKRVAGVDHPVEYGGPHGHHLEDTFRILAAHGIAGPPPPPRLGIEAPVAPRLASTPLVGIHVSARKPRNRWREAHYAQFMRALHDRTGMQFRLFWSPGDGDDPRHPGDDPLAARIAAQARGLPVEPFATRTLRELAHGIAACDAFVCSDGGAMHLAAALGKPILCFFGDSPASEWHPWGVPYRLLQPPSLDARDIAVDAALEAFDGLVAQLRAVA